MKSSPGSWVWMARNTLSPPTPESKAPTGATLSEGALMNKKQAPASFYRSQAPVGYTRRKVCLFFKLLLKSALLPRKAAQIGQMGAAYFGAVLQHDFVDQGRSQQEGAFDPNTVAGNAPHAEVAAVAGPAYPHHGPLELLNALAVPLFDLDVHAHQVAGAQGWDIRVDSGLCGL